MSGHIYLYGKLRFLLSLILMGKGLQGHSWDLLGCIQTFTLVFMGLIGGMGLLFGSCRWVFSGPLVLVFPPRCHVQEKLFP